MMRENISVISQIQRSMSYYHGKWWGKTSTKKAGMIKPDVHVPQGVGAKYIMEKNDFVPKLYFIRLESFFS